MNFKKLFLALFMVLMLSFSVSALSTSQISNVNIIGYMNKTNESYPAYFAGDLTVYNDTNSGKVLYVNTTSGKTEFWNPAEGANDYVSVYHDGSYGRITSGAGAIRFSPNNAERFHMDGASFLPLSANIRDLGHTDYEWKSLYLGEDAGSGAYFGLDQNYRLSYNETSADELQLINGSGALMTRWGDITSIGDGTDSHSLSSNDDLFVTGKLEVDGTGYFDGTSEFVSQATYFAGIALRDNANIVFGTGSDSYLDWSTAQATENTLVWGLGDDAKSIIYTTENNKAKDHDVPAQSNPKLFMFSNEDPDNDNTRWGSISHDNTSFVIDSGSDNITLDDTTNVAGNLNLGDNELGEDKFRICYNGTQTILDMYSPNSTLFSCGVNNTGSFVCSSVSTWSCT